MYEIEICIYIKVRGIQVIYLHLCNLMINYLRVLITRLNDMNLKAIIYLRFAGHFKSIIAIATFTLAIIFAS